MLLVSHDVQKLLVPMYEDKTFAIIACLSHSDTLRNCTSAVSAAASMCKC